MVSENQKHWNKIYTEKSPTEVSWFQQNSGLSLSLIDEKITPNCHIIDIGGGASLLVDNLLEREGVSVSVVDIASSALEHTKNRLGDRAQQVTFIESDIMNPLSEIEVDSIDIWHDRAVFHFLVSQEQRLGYAENIHRIVKSKGSIIISTFALDGPEKCSGLEVCRYDGALLQTTLKSCGLPLLLQKEIQSEHTTPWGTVQKFTFAMFTKL